MMTGHLTRRRTQRNATQRNATQRNATQRHAQSEVPQPNLMVERMNVSDALEFTAWRGSPVIGQR
jgi:hypothetical protein